MAPAGPTGCAGPHWSGACGRGFSVSVVWMAAVGLYWPVGIS